MANISYNKTTWVNGSTALNAANLNNIEMGVDNATKKIYSIEMYLGTAMHRIDDLEYEVDYHGFDMSQPFDKDNSVRIGTEFSTEEWTLKRSDDEIELSDEDASKAKEILLKAIKYGFIAYIDGPNNEYGVLVNANKTDVSVFATFAINTILIEALGFLAIYLKREGGKWKYLCKTIPM